MFVSSLTIFCVSSTVEEDVFRFISRSNSSILISDNTTELSKSLLDI